MFYITDNLQAEIMTKNNEGAFSLDSGVEGFYWELAVVSVRDLLSGRRNLNKDRYDTVLVEGVKNER